MKFVQCNCVTKTPEPKYHKRNCPVWMADRIEKLEGNIRKTRSALRMMEDVGVFKDNFLNQKVVRNIMEDSFSVLEIDKDDGIDL